MPAEQNDERYPTDLTERLTQEPLCVACGKDVTEWMVSFESSIHDDSGYSKRYRCPHCGELCFEDQHEDLGCLLFFLVFFSACLPWFWLLAEFFGPLEADEAGDLHGEDAIQAGCAITLAFATACVLTNTYLRIKHRRIAARTVTVQLDDEDAQPPR